jgi:hypothetical protein
VPFIRAFVVVLPLAGLVAAACSGSSATQGTGGAAGTGTGGRGGSGGKAGAGSGGSSGATGGRAGTGGTAGNGEGGEAASTGGGAGTGGSAGTGGIPIGMAPAAIASAICAKVFECCSAEQRMTLGTIGETEDQCRAFVEAFLGLYQLDIRTSIAAMRAEYDGQALAECVAEHQDRACDMLPAFEEIGCPGAVVPLIPLGETCGAHHECIDGYCEGASSASSPSGTCTVKKAEGEPCTDPSECEGGACSTETGCGSTTGAPICGE